MYFIYNMNNNNCAICFGDDGYICGDVNCKCVEFEEDDPIVKVIHETVDDNVGHYFHTSCLYHYHEHNRGDCFICPLCKNKINTTDPCVDFLANLNEEESIGYLDKEIIHNHYITTMTYSMTIHDVKSFLQWLRMSFNTTQYDFTRILIPTFHNHVLYMQTIISKYIQSPNSLPVSICYSDLDFDRKIKILKILNRYHGFQYDSEFFIDLIGFYKRGYKKLNEIFEHLLNISPNPNEVLTRIPDFTPYNTIDMIAIHSVIDKSLMELYDYLPDGVEIPVLSERFMSISKYIIAESPFRIVIEQFQDL